jgi:hypothetical protein
MPCPWRPEFGPEGKHFDSGTFFYFEGAVKLRWAGGGAQRPVWRVNKPKKTGARTRGQNPLVCLEFFLHKIYFLFKYDKDLIIFVFA